MRLGNLLIGRLAYQKGAVMTFTAFVALNCVLGMQPSLAAVGDAPAAKSASESPSPKDRLAAQNLADAAEYRIFRDATQQTPLELRREPVYLWTNPTRDGGQTGSVFVWTHNGRPEVVGTIFSHPENGKRVMCHEFHSLSPEIIYPRRESQHQWQPQAGASPHALEGASAPSSAEKQRQLQMRRLAREFSAKSVDRNGQTWELRLLPQPLYRYASASAGIIDGALFAFVTSAGTDPELILLLEARHSQRGDEWTFVSGRFSDLDLHLSRDGKEVWSSIRSEENTFDHDPKHLFRFYRDRMIDEIAEASP